MIRRWNLAHNAVSFFTNFLKNASLIGRYQFRNCQQRQWSCSNPCHLPSQTRTNASGCGDSTRLQHLCQHRITEFSSPFSGDLSRVPILFKPRTNQSIRNSRRILARPEDHTWRILDYKSNEIAVEQIEAEIQRHGYDVQMRIYALALSRLLQTDRITCTLFFTFPGCRYEALDLSPSALKRFEQELFTTLQQLKKNPLEMTKEEISVNTVNTDAQACGKDANRRFRKNTSMNDIYSFM